MRVMKKNDSNVKVNIIKHIITKNYEEIFVTDAPYEHPDGFLCYLLSDKNYFTRLDRDQIRIMSLLVTEEKELHTIHPATGWEWIG